MVNYYPKKKGSRFFDVPDRKTKFPDFRNTASSGNFAPNAYRPDNIVSRAKKNSNLLTQIKYKPIGSRRRRRFPAAVNMKGKSGTAAAGKPLTPSLTMPLLPVIGLLFLGTFFILDNSEAISSMIHRDVIPYPAADSGGEASMAAYAGGTALTGRQVSGEQPDLPDPAAADISGDSAAAAAPALAGIPVSVTVEETIPLKMVEYFAWESYSVKKGDSVSSIAASHGISMDAVIASNDLSNANMLKVGQNLRLPNMNGIPYVVKKGDTLTKISKTYNIPLEVIADVNDIQRDLIIPGQTVFLPGARMPAFELSMAIGTQFVSPLKGAGARLSSSFGWREDPFGAGQRLHEALDLAISTGTPVKAAAAGKVSTVGVSPVYGNYIIINNGNNFQTLYAHLSAFSVKQGESVSQGVKIGEVGSTGLSTGPHLHFAIYKNGHAVNPLDYISL